MKEIINALKNIKGSTLILAHHNADADAIASAIGLYKYFLSRKIKAVIGVGESVSRSAQKLLTGFEIEIDPDCKRFENIILVDGSSSDQFSTVKNLNKIDIIIDHHIPGDLIKKAKHALVLPDERSSSQIIYNILKELEFHIDKKMAKILASGILSDTAYLRLARKKELNVFLELLKTSDSDVIDIIKMIEVYPDISERVASLKAVTRAEIYKVGELLIAISKLSSHEAAASRSLVKIGADIGIVVAKKKNDIRISSRARDSILSYGIDLSEIFKEVGKIIEGSGGGHNLAGSANGKNKNVKKAISFILKSISDKVGERWKKLK